jgi:hypothetical protein
MSGGDGMDSVLECIVPDARGILILRHVMAVA